MIRKWVASQYNINIGGMKSSYSVSLGVGMKSLIIASPWGEAKASFYTVSLEGGGVKSRKIE